MLSEGFRHIGVPKVQRQVSLWCRGSQRSPIGEVNFDLVFKEFLVFVEVEFIQAEGEQADAKVGSWTPL